MDQNAKKQVLRSFSYGLYAITVNDGDKPHGMVANWVTQAAFEPPMVAVAMERESQTLALTEQTQVFGVNVLASGQRELAGQLGRSSAKRPDKMAGIATHPGPETGVPILDEALGWLECHVVGTLPAGDHVLVLGVVIEAGVQREGQALTLAEAGFRYAG
ncbi:MAG: flavin reductase family protein [Ardenticatenaceae bacterium]|nr:flavin reductase family protein [Ardenticatenaceae bacterium]HBY94049.1 flavin reductase [Chloroflexota bacterium]